MITLDISGQLPDSQYNLPMMWSLGKAIQSCGIIDIGGYQVQEIPRQNKSSLFTSNSLNPYTRNLQSMLK